MRTHTQQTTQEFGNDENRIIIEEGESGLITINVWMEEPDIAIEVANNIKNQIEEYVSDVHLKYAFHLEDEKRYKEAEEHFVKAGKPAEAINMYEHLGDFKMFKQVYQF